MWEHLGAIVVWGSATGVILQGMNRNKGNVLGAFQGAKEGVMESAREEGNNQMMA